MREVKSLIHRCLRQVRPLKIKIKFKHHQQLENNSSVMGNILIISNNNEWIDTAYAVLNAHLYEVDTAFSGDEVIFWLRKKWYNMALLDLGSMDVPVDYLVKNIKKMEPDIPIIGLGRNVSGKSTDILYIKNPLTSKKIMTIFPELITDRERKSRNKTLYGLLLGVSIAIIIWTFIFIFF